MRPALLLSVLLLHGLLLWGLLSWRSTALEPPRRALTIPLRLITERPAAPTPSTARPRLRWPAAPQLMQPPAPPEPVVALPAPTSPAATITAALPASAPASATRPPALLDSEATRQAIRRAARETPALAAAPTESAQQRLGREIANSADGDCLKGEFAGAGMGLLSAPFWLLAEARGKCRR